MRMTRRFDQLRQAQKATVGLNIGAKGVGTKMRVDEKPALAEQGIDKESRPSGPRARTPMAAATAASGQARSPFDLQRVGEILILLLTRP